MRLPGYPDYNWGKDEYLEEVKWYQRNMVAVNKMKLTQKQRVCLKKIIKTNTESIDILKNSGKRLSNSEKGQLYELAMLRLGVFAGFFIKE